MNLYQVTTKGLGVHYVVAEDPTSAYKLIRDDFDKNDYGFVYHRELDSIHLLATEMEYQTHGNRLWVQEDVV